MTQYSFKKARLATAVALISSTALLTGCLVDGDKSNSTSNTTHQDADRIVISQQQAQKAQVVGIVQDTNGNPVANASVSIGFKTVKTNAEGVYYLADIPVTGLEDLAGPSTATPLEIAIVPAQGDKNYLNATVSVIPSANMIIQTQGGADGNDKDSLIAYVQQDGLAVSAGVTVIPELKSTVKGVLLNEENGRPVAGAVVGLDVLGVNGVDQQQTQNGGVGTSYGVGTYQAATNDAGEFEFALLPVDTEFQINIDNWTNITPKNNGNMGDLTLAGQFSTTPEATEQNIGDIKAKFIATVDDVDPFVLSVSEVRVNGTTGLLKDQVDGTEGLTINFSEPVVIEHIEDAIYIKNTTTPADAIRVDTAELSADGKTLVIKTVDPIAEGVEFSIHLNIVDVQDKAGNTLVVNPPTFNDKTIARYDYAVTNAVSTFSTLELKLKTYSRAILETGAAVGITQVMEDNRTSNFQILQSLNSTFIDLDSGSLRANDTNIEQLNSPVAAVRLNDLAAATLTVGAPASVDTTTARVRFTLDATTPARNYVLQLKNSDGALKDVTVDEQSAAITLNAVTNGTDTVEFKVDDKFNGELDLILKAAAGNVEHGDHVVIASVNDLGILVATTSLVLEDKVAPTTVLQTNYGLGDKTNAVTQPNYGDGGELAENGSASLGTPLFNVTARLLTPQIDDAPLPVADTWKALTDLVDKDDDGTKQVSDAGLTGYALYDANAWTAWNGIADARTRNVGIAFSESIALTGTPAYTGNVGLLSDWTAQNNVVKNDINGPVLVDLANVQVADIVTFANDNHNTVIDFTGVVADLQGNTATAANNAKVVVRDRLAPLPTSAVYNGDNIVVTFNEELGELTDTSEVELEGITIGSLDTDATLSADKKTLTIKSSAWGVQFSNKDALFARGTYDHDGNNLTVDANHGALKVNEIADVRGNTWANSNTGAAQVDAPAIVIRDAVGAFEVTRTGTLSAGTSTINLTFKFSHRIDLQDLGAGLGDTSLSAAATAGLFTLTSAATIDATGNTTKATLDASGRVLTVTLNLTGVIAAGDTLVSSGVTVDSAWDGAATQITELFSGTITAQ